MFSQDQSRENTEKTNKNLMYTMNTQQDEEEEEEEEEEIEDSYQATVKTSSRVKNVKKSGQNIFLASMINESLRLKIEYRLSLDELEFFRNRRLICKDIRKLFQKDFEEREEESIKKVTKNQVVRIINQDKPLNLNEENDIKNYIVRKGYNFNYIDQIEKLGQGGESQIFRLIVVQPVEVVAKMPIVSQEGSQSSNTFKDLLMESHLLKMVEHPEYICEVMEEIIEYNPDKQEIIGYVAIVEQANNDLKQTVKIWKDTQKAEMKQEYFCEKKLAYYCLKAIEAVAYLHSKNVVFCDIKPENFLIFRDLKIKLGDFGISIKLPDNANDDTEVGLKGLTQGYTSPLVLNKYRNGELVTYKELKENDKYALWVTFQKIYDEFKTQLSKDTMIYKMIKDLRTIGLQLSDIFLKWQKVIQEKGGKFILDLCDRLRREEKHQAIPQILRLSKFRFFIDQIMFKNNENQPQYMKDTQYQPIEEDKIEIIQKDWMVPGQEQLYEKFSRDYEKKDLLPFLLLLLVNQNVKEIFFEKLYVYQRNDIIITWKDLLNYPIKHIHNAVAIEVNESTISYQESTNKLYKIERNKDNHLPFHYFFLFHVRYHINNKTITQDKNPERILRILEVSQKYNIQELIGDVAYYFNIGMQGESKYVNECEQMASLLIENCKAQKSSFGKAVISYINYAKCAYAAGLSKGKIYDILKKAEKLTQKNWSFWKTEIASLYQLKFLLNMNNTGDNEKQKLKIYWEEQLQYLESERQILSLTKGQDDPKMSLNSFYMYQIYKQFDIQKALFYVEKCANFAAEKQRYLIYLAEAYKSIKKQDQFLETLHRFNKIDKLCEAIALSFFNYPYRQSIEDKQYAKNTLRQFKYIEKNYFLFRCDQYFIGLLKIFKCDQSQQNEYTLIDNLSKRLEILKELQQQWLSQQYTKEIVNKKIMKKVQPLEVKNEEILKYCNSLQSQLTDIYQKFFQFILTILTTNDANQFHSKSIDFSLKNFEQMNHIYFLSSCNLEQKKEVLVFFSDIVKKYQINESMRENFISQGTVLYLLQLIKSIDDEDYIYLLSQAVLLFTWKNKIQYEAQKDERQLKQEQKLIRDFFRILVKDEQITRDDVNVLSGVTDENDEKIKKDKWDFLNQLSPAKLNEQSQQNESDQNESADILEEEKIQSAPLLIKKMSSQQNKWKFLAKISNNIVERIETSSFAQEVYEILNELYKFIKPQPNFYKIYARIFINTLQLLFITKAENLQNLAKQVIQEELLTTQNQDLLQAFNELDLISPLILCSLQNYISNHELLNIVAKLLDNIRTDQIIDLLQRGLMRVLFSHLFTEQERLISLQCIHKIISNVKNDIEVRETVIDFMILENGPKILDGMSFTSANEEEIGISNQIMQMSKSFLSMSAPQQIQFITSKQYESIEVEDVVKVYFFKEPLVLRLPGEKQQGYSTWRCDGKQEYGRCQVTDAFRPSLGNDRWNHAETSYDLCKECIQLAFLLERIKTKLQQREKAKVDFSYFASFLGGNQSIPFHWLTLKEQASLIKEEDYISYQVEKEVSVAQHEHPLSMNQRSTWYCNGRYYFDRCFGKSNYGVDDKRWRCLKTKKCDFDFCEPCIQVCYAIRDKIKDSMEQK